MALGSGQTTLPLRYAALRHYLTLAGQTLDSINALKTRTCPIICCQWRQRLRYLALKVVQLINARPVAHAFSLTRTIYAGVYLSTFRKDFGRTGVLLASFASEF